VVEGDCKSLKEGSFSTLLANINLNILLQDMPCYSERLRWGGLAILSGFYEKNLGQLDQAAHRQNLIRKDVNTLNSWTVAVYTKGA
jgi:ribosomal protein L11 methyltransferase